MGDDTIAAIKVKLGVDASSVKGGVDEANKSLKALAGETRKVNVEITPILKSGTSATSNFLKQIETVHKVKIDVDVNKEGRSSIANVRSKITEGLKAGGGVSIPVKIAIPASESAKLRRDIADQIGVVKVDFDWVATKPPSYDGPPIEIEWKFKDDPNGPPGSQGPAAPSRPSAPPSAGPAPKAGPTSGPAPEYKKTYQAGRQEGETKADASARHKAETAADAAAKRAAEQEAKTAREQTSTSRSAEQDTRRERQNQSRGKNSGARTTTPGPSGDTVARAEATATREEKKAADSRTSRARAETATNTTAARAASAAPKAGATTPAEPAATKSSGKAKTAPKAAGGTPPKQTFPCDECSSTFLTQGHLDDHRQKKHGVASPSAAPEPKAALGGTGTRSKPRAKPKPVESAPVAGATTSGTTATAPASAGQPRMGIREVSGGGGKPKKGTALHPLAGARPSSRGWDWSEGEDLPGETPQIRSARLARLHREGESDAQQRYRDELVGSISPETRAMFSVAGGGLEQVFPEIEAMFGEEDPNKKRTMAKDFRARRMGFGGQTSTGEVIPRNPKLRKAFSKVGKDVEKYLTNRPDLSSETNAERQRLGHQALFIGALAGSASLESLLGLGGEGMVNLTGAASGARPVGERGTKTKVDKTRHGYRSAVAGGLSELMTPAERASSRGEGSAADLMPKAFLGGYDTNLNISGNDAEQAARRGDSEHVHAQRWRDERAAEQARFGTGPASFRDQVAAAETERSFLKKDIDDKNLAGAIHFERKPSDKAGYRGVMRGELRKIEGEPPAGKAITALINKLKKQDPTTKFAEGGEWDKPVGKNPNPIPYQYPDDYRPKPGDSPYAGRQGSDRIDYNRERVPKAPSPYPEWSPYYTDAERAKKVKGFAEGGNPYTHQDFADFYAEEEKRKVREAGPSDKFGRPPRCTAWASKRPGGCPLPSGHSGPHDVPEADLEQDAEDARFRMSHDAPKFGGSDVRSSEPAFNPLIDKLKRMAGQTEQSPNEAAIAKAKLHDKGVSGYAEGGKKFNPLSRPFGVSYGGEGEKSASATQDPIWMARKRAHIAKNPFCAYCGEKRSEASKRRSEPSRLYPRGKKMHLTGDTIMSFSEAKSKGLPDPHLDFSQPIQTLCTSCQPAAGAAGHEHVETWKKPRPYGLINSPELKERGISRLDFMSGGPLFGVQSLAQALKILSAKKKVEHKAEGGLSGIKFTDTSPGAFSGIKFTDTSPGASGRMLELMAEAFPAAKLSGLDKLSAEDLLPIFSSAMSLANKYPKSAGKLAGITISDRRDRIGPRGQKLRNTNLGQVDGLEKTSPNIWLSPNTIGAANAKKLSKRTDDMEFAAIRDAGGVFSHEFGHVVDATNKFSGSIMSEVLGKPQISDYGNTQGAPEAFAESFGLLNSNDPRDATRKSEFASRRPDWATSVGSLTGMAEGGLPRLARDFVGPTVKDRYGNYDLSMADEDYEHNPFDESGDDLFDKRRGNSLADRLGKRPKVRSHAEGGAYVKHSGLLQRMASAGHEPSIRLLTKQNSGSEPGIEWAERGNELGVSDPNTGETDIVPTHKVPQWLQRAKEGSLRGKDLTGYASGGLYRGKFMAEPGSGVRGRKIYRDSFPGERAAVGSGALSPQGGIQRVFVTNWPPAATVPPIAGNPNPSASSRTRTNQNANQSANAAPNAGPNAGPNPNAGTPPLHQTVGGSGGQAGAAAIAAVIASRMGPTFKGEDTAERQTRKRAAAFDYTQLESKVQEAKSMTPSRAFTTGMAQLFQQASGRAGIQSRAKFAETNISQAKAITGEMEAAQARVEGEKRRIGELEQYKSLAQSKGEEFNPKDQEDLDRAKSVRLPNEERVLAGLRQEKERADIIAKGGKPSAALPEVIAARQAVKDAKTPEERTEAKTNAAKYIGAEDVLQRGDVSKNVISGFVGLAGATVAMKLAFTGITMAMGALDEGVKSAGERMIGYRNVAADMGKSLGAAVVQQEGNTKAVVASTLSLSGMNAKTAGQITPALEGRAGTIAGNDALQSRIEQMASASQFGSDRPEGLPQGFDTNLVKTVGGFMNLGLGPGSTQPTAERLQQYIGDNGRSLSFEQNLGPYTRAGESSAISNGPGNPTNWSEPEKFKKALAYMADQSESAGLSLKLVAEAGLEQTEASKKTSEALAGIGAGQFATETTRQNLAIEGLDQSNPERARLQAAQWMQSQNTLVRTPEEIQKQGEKGRWAAGRALSREANYQRTQEIPANAAMQYIARPLTPYGVATMTGATGKQVPTGQLPTQNMLPGVPGYGAQKAAYSSDTAYGAGGSNFQSATKAVGIINEQVTKGRDVLKTWGVPPEKIKDIETMGMAIRDATAGIEQRSLNLTVASYNNELRVAKRSLGDARDITAAIGGNVKHTLGGMEGQNLVLGRQLQLLEQGMAQRQINFKVAMAGFTAPGDTPEQRQARIDQAKLEAAFEQKKLNIGKKTTANQFDISTISATRSVTDLQAQISLLTQSRTLAIDMSATQKSVDLMNAAQELLMADAKTYAAEGQGNAKLIMQAITDIETESGKAFNAVGTGLADAFGKAGDAFVAAINEGLKPSNYEPTSNHNGAGDTGGKGGPGRGNTPPPPKTDPNWPYGPGKNWDGSKDHNGYAFDTLANGIVGSTAGPHTMTVGEAGTEEVAILRNPRMASMPMMGGGGGGVVNVNVNINGGGGDLNEQKLHAWGKQIQMNVEQALNRKTSLLGLRNT